MKNVKRIGRKSTIYGTGLVALDIVIGSNPREPAYQWAGGTCGNVMSILSYLGWNSFPIARLNDDPSSVLIRNDFKKWNVRLDYSSLAPTSNAPIITQEIFRDKQGNPTHKFHWRNCPKCGSYLPNYSPVTLKNTQVIKDSVKNADVVYFFDRTSPGALDLARHFKELGAVVFFEPSAKGTLKHFEEALEIADVVKYSNQRFSSIVNSEQIRNNKILEIQTLGDNGIRYRYSRRGVWKNISAFENEDFRDSCGCGDWTTAGIICKLFDNKCDEKYRFSIKNIEEAIRYGQALGAWNCSFEGARGGMYRVTKKVFFEEIDSILLNGKLKIQNHTRRPNAQFASDGLCPSCPVAN